MKNNDIFKSTFRYKLIYIFRINDSLHDGILKIGDATIYYDGDVSTLKDNCTALNESAKKRIDQYTKTAGITYQLLYTTLAITKNGNAFRDYKVHDLLKRSGIEKKFLNSNNRNEWFKVNLETAINSINAVKEGRTSLKSQEMNEKLDPIIFRPEQESAIEKTIKQYKKGNRMLWNAKMRFGKTLSALEVVKRMNFKKTIIITHRPVVSEGWFNDFKLIFRDENYIFGSKVKGEKFENLIKSDKNIIYFASIQDLRGSEKVGGNFEKNSDIFNTNWDFVVVDEAHEGTKTDQGTITLSEIIKNNDNHDTKVLELSGTPFNLLSDFEEDEIYTWDYVMEQEAKLNWEINNYCDPNPYEELPKLNIFTYNLNKLIPGFEEIMDKAFNFKEFFRVWTGNKEIDKVTMPSSSSIGDFVHEKDINSFLNLLSKKDEYSNYPFSTDEYRNYFRHSLWILPGVKEAKALSKLLKAHPIFSQFNIANVAGDGDEEKAYQDSLNLVRHAIGKNEDNYSITLSCGRLTTGVSVPEWTAVFMLAGSYSTAASNYLQTIFRVQTPANINGKIKEECYVFDFAPDRTLKMVAQAGQLSIKAGSTSSKKIMGAFLNYCPVIAVSGSNMEKYSVDKMLQQLKKAYADKVVQNGFDDPKIYNDNLLKLDGIELEKFDELQKIVGVSKQTKKANQIDINKQGFTNAELEQIEEIERKPKRTLTEEEKKKLEELKKQKEQASTAISILRGISIRIPLLIYGANIDINEDINCNNFVELIDDQSWEEFMPRGVTKEMFIDFSKYYDQDIFVEAGRQIRKKALYADSLNPDERTKTIAEIFATFKNPDKETVLTPWKTVNAHMSETIGGYSFIKHDDNDCIITVEEPKYIEIENVTKNIFDKENPQILEINSKTGLYPLYITYSLFRRKAEKQNINGLDIELMNALWNKIVENDIFVLCKTEMAKSITKRTLVGYSNVKTNIINISTIIDDFKDNNTLIFDKILMPETWCKEGEKMKFDAIVGNPPYQLMDDGHGASAIPVYNVFIDGAKKLKPNYISMIIPSRWFAGGKGLDSFRDSMLRDKNIRILHDYISATSVFPGVEIKGGVCYFLRNFNDQGKCKIYTHSNNNVSNMERYLLEDDCDIFIRYNEAIPILNKIKSNNFVSFSNIVSARKPFGLATNFTDYSEKKVNEDDLKIFANKNIGYVKKTSILKNSEWINKWKIFVPEAIGSGDTKTDWVKPIIGKPGYVCTETYLVYGPFESERETYNCAIYTQTKFFHFMLGLKKITQHTTTKVYSYVPMQNFKDNSDIDWSKSTTEIDQLLYKKYNLSQFEISFIEENVRGLNDNVKEVE